MATREYQQKESIMIPENFCAYDSLSELDLACMYRDRLSTAWLTT